MAKALTTKRNPQDLTLRNLRAMKKHMALLTETVLDLTHRVSKLERKRVS